MYLNGIETVFNREERNDDGGVRAQGFAAFTQNVRPFGLIGRAPDVTVDQRNMAQWFVMYNSPEVEPYLECVLKFEYVLFVFSLVLYYYS
jgi:hypothetical protein